MDELGLFKPTRKEHVKASVVGAIDKGEFAEPRGLQNEIDRMIEHECPVRGAKKTCKKIIEVAR